MNIYWQTTQDALMHIKICLLQTNSGSKQMPQSTQKLVDPKGMLTKSS
jgi:hypothetical protein